MAKAKKPVLKANKITPLEGVSTPTIQKESKPVKPKKEKETPKDKVGPKKKNGDNWKKSMIQLDPETKKMMLTCIAASDTLTTQSIFIDKAIKHYAEYLENQ